MNGFGQTGTSHEFQSLEWDTKIVRVLVRMLVMNCERKNLGQSPKMADILVLTLVMNCRVWDGTLK